MKNKDAWREGLPARTPSALNQIRPSTVLFSAAAMLYYVYGIVAYAAVEDWSSALSYILQLWGFWLSAIVLDKIGRSVTGY